MNYQNPIITLRIKGDVSSPQVTVLLPDGHTIIRSGNSVETAAWSSKADTVHAHAGSDITSGTIAAARLGTGTPGSGNFLRGDGSWQTVSGGSGTVTSVGLSLPAEITVSNSPVTTSGTLTGAWANQTTNKVFAAPNGSTGTPTFRALVAADIPTIAQSQVTNLTSDLALKAALASPALTGSPTAPTQSASDNSTKIATTAYADAAVGSKASSASPTLTGTPVAPTAAVDTNTTQIATTAFVLAQAAAATPIVAGTGAVGTSTRYARGDHVHPAQVIRKTIACTFDGGNGTPAVGSKCRVVAPEACTIVKSTILADASGSAVVDVLKSTYSGFPTTASIAASAKPTISSAQKAQDSTLTGWTTAVSAGDVVEFNLDSVTTCKQVQVFLEVTVP